MTTSAGLDTAALSDCVEAMLPDALDRLKEMVNTNSFTWNAAGVNRVGDLTLQMFESLGFQAERPQAINCVFEPMPPLGRHLILTRPGRSERRVGMVGHFDTVFTEQDEQDNDFHWREAGERIYGPGTVDMKGGNVLLWMTLNAMRQTAPALFDAVTWVVMFDAAEEGLSSDFAMLERQYLGKDAIANLVFEGGNFENGEHRMISHRKGRASLRATALGRAAHAGASHERGANALVQISDFVKQVSNLTDYDKDLTCNVGILQGGTTTNRVPDRACAQLEMRAFDGTLLEQTLKQAMSLDGMSTVSSAADGYAARVEVVCTQHLACWPANPATDRLVSIWQKAGASLGMNVTGAGRGGLSDGNFTQDLVPTIDGLGPAGANAHCAIRTADGSVDQEYVLPGTMQPRTMLNVLAIEQLLREAGVV